LKRSAEPAKSGIRASQNSVSKWSKKRALASVRLLSRLSHNSVSKLVERFSVFAIAALLSA
jgi:hypothetical protein